MSNWSRRNPFDASHDNPLPTTSYSVLENGAYVPTAVTPPTVAVRSSTTVGSCFARLNTREDQ